MRNQRFFVFLLSALFIHTSEAAQPNAASTPFAVEAFAPRALWHFAKNFWPLTPCVQAIQPLLPTASEHGAGETPNSNPNEFLRNVRHHAETAASYLDVPSTTLDELLTPQRILRFTVVWPGDDGVLNSAPGWRIIHYRREGFAGKGGIRMVATLVEEEVMALAAEMDVKLTGSKLGGAKGGVAVNPQRFSKGEYARLIRAYTFAALEQVYSEYGELAFGVDIDVPAPDINTSPSVVNLMNIAADATVEWLVHHPDQPFEKLPSTLNDVTPRASNDDTSTPYLDAVLSSGQKRLAASFTGKSLDKGGSEVRTEATGLGLAYATIEALKADGRLDPKADHRFQGQTVAIQGFGNVGQGAVKSFTELGAEVKAIAEFDGEPYVLYRDQGGFPSELQAVMKSHLNTYRSLRDFPTTEIGRRYGLSLISIDAFWALPVDILAPCAKENSITPDIAWTVQAQYIAEGANGPTTYGADDVLKEKGIPVIPDVLANSGGVLVSAFEMAQNAAGESWTPDQVREKLRKKIHENFQALREIGSEYRVSLRTAAYIRWIQLRLGDRYKPSLKNRLRHLQWSLREKVLPRIIPTTSPTTTPLQREVMLSV